MCHSLGGIVVTQVGIPYLSSQHKQTIYSRSQALTLALAKPAIKPEFQFIQQMVRGVAYFGTPFQGSRNADFMAPIASIVGSVTRVNTSFIGDLKTFSSDKLPRLMMLFNNIRNEEKIEVLVFIEKLPDGPAKVVRSSGRSKPAPMTNVSSRRHGLPQHYHSHHQLCLSKLMQAIEIW